MIKFNGNFKKICDLYDFTDLYSLIDFIDVNFSHDGSRTGDRMRHITQWPNDLLNNRIGNCVDLSLFVYYIFKYYNKYKMLRTDSTLFFIYSKPSPTDMLKNKVKSKIGHAVPLIKLDGNVFIINCSPYNLNGEQLKNSCIFGPFDSYERASENLFGYIMTTIQSFGHEKFPYYSAQPIANYITLTKNELKIIDSYYDKQIMQSSLLSSIDRLCYLYEGKALQSSVVFKPLNINNGKAFKYFGQSEFSVSNHIYDILKTLRFFKQK